MWQTQRSNPKNTAGRRQRLVFTFEFVEAGIADAEVVRNLMKDDFPDFFDNFVVSAADGLDRFLEDRDAVWEDHAISMVAFGERYAFVETEERGIGLEMGRGTLLPRGIVVDHDGDVIEAPCELGWKAVESLIDQGFERFAVQSLHLNWTLEYPNPKQSAMPAGGRYHG